MSGQERPASASQAGAGSATLPPDAPDPMFVGGTGRSGTHAMAELVGKHSRYRYIYKEVRFHTDQGSLPDLLAGNTTLREFLARMRGEWWARERPEERVAGMHGMLPQDLYENALSEFERSFELDPLEASRRLIRALLDPVAERKGKPSWIEQSTRNVSRAPTLLALFPDAKIIHTIRDGRDVAASVVNRPWGPDSISEALRRWDRQLRAADAGARQVPSERLLLVSLEDLVRSDREATYRRLLDFLRADDEPGIREHFDTEMVPEHANLDRWRADLSEQEQRKLTRDYARYLARMLRDGVSVAPELVRRAGLEDEVEWAGRSPVRRAVGRLGRRGA